VAAAVVLSGCADARPVEWAAGDLRLAIDRTGHVSRMADGRSGSDYRADEVASPVLSVQTGGVLHPPIAFAWHAEERVAEFSYENGVIARVAVTPKQTHLLLEVTEVGPLEQVELVAWGPFATTLADTIGETVGVVRDAEFAIGLQALNIKTLGGLPWNDNDFPPQVDLFEDGDFDNLSGEGRRGVLFRVEAAKPERFGSTRQAYTRDRGRERVIRNWSHERYVAPAFDDGGVIGSAIALFGAPTANLLEVLGAIELAEGLPHPTVDGEWGKTARSASAAYLILDFGEDDVERAIGWTKRAGLRYLYHPDPFESWGHFALKRDRFPNGRAGLKRAVAKAEAAGVYVGLHTLSNFITTDDPYVTPIPDPRLAQVGASRLREAVSATQTEIPVASPAFFAQYDNNTLRTVVVGNELIQYRTVSDAEPWTLLDCRRGAFGTTASAHRAGDEVALLADHGYRVFLTNAELGREVAVNLAELFNETGVRQISFDGLEGNQSTGMGNYGEALFTTTWYATLSADIQSHLIVDASRTSHYFWHIYTRMNWGEPWYAGFRESQTEYRMKNQPYFRRNLMPGMLGWFRMTAETTIEDVEWMLARSAAFDAGYAFVTGYEELEENGFTARMLDAIALWERARMADAFSAKEKRRMEDVDSEFHLEAAGDRGFTLTQVHPQVFRHERGVRQPGEPSSSTFELANPGAAQTLRWILSAEDGEVSQIRLAIDDGEPISLPVRLRAGWSLRYEGGSTVTIRDAGHRRQGVVRVDELRLRIAPGRHAVTLDAGLTPADQAKARLELRVLGRGESIGQ
jgi:hypothetical protein